MLADKDKIIEKKSLKDKVKGAAGSAKARAKIISNQIKEIIIKMKTKLKEVVTKATHFISEKLTVAKKLKVNNAAVNQIMIAFKALQVDITSIMGSWAGDEKVSEEKLDNIVKTVNRSRTALTLQNLSFVKYGVKEVSSQVIKQNIQAGKSMCLASIKEAEKLERKILSINFANDKKDVKLETGILKKILSAINAMFGLGINVMLLMLTSQVKLTGSNDKFGAGDAKVL